jgi:hypothetical protein
MSTTVPAALASDELQRDRSSAMSSRMAFGITVAIWGAIVLALAWVLPPASSYRVMTPTPQWITGL